MEMIKRFVRLTLLDSWREADAQADTAGSDQIDWRPVVVLVTTAVTLTLARYYGNNATFSELIPYDKKIYTRDEWDLMARAWWSGTRVVTYVLIPMATIALMPGERIRDDRPGGQRGVPRGPAFRREVLDLVHLRRLEIVAAKKGHPMQRLKKCLQEISQS